MNPAAPVTTILMMRDLSRQWLSISPHHTRIIGGIGRTDLSGYSISRPWAHGGFLVRSPRSGRTYLALDPPGRLKGSETRSPSRVGRVMHRAADRRDQRRSCPTRRSMRRSGAGRTGRALRLDDARHRADGASFEAGDDPLAVEDAGVHRHGRHDPRSARDRQQLAQCSRSRPSS